MLMATESTSLAGSAVSLETHSDLLLIRHDQRTLSVSLACPTYVFDTATLSGGKPTSTKGDIRSGKPVQASFDPIPLTGGQLEVKLLVQWSPKEAVLRKWAKYRITGAAPGVLKEIVLEAMKAPGARLEPQPPQSYPAFLDGFFLGIEYPIASTRVENGDLILAHKPGLKMQPGVWYETRKAIYGVAGSGNEKRAFQNYIAAHRARPREFHANYNSWWTSPVPYTEADILGVMQAFAENLYKPYRASFDTFCIDMGWSDPHSLWEIDKKLFPNGFAKIEKAAEEMHSHLGLWISPSSCYPAALDNDWAQAHGFETFADGSQRFACLAGEHYRAKLQESLVEMVTRWGVRHIKFDGYRPTCSAVDHGHEPGDLSAEAVSEGIISVFRAVHEAAPGTWIETTCFGWDPSPWWLFHVNSVIGTYGDDAPYGRVPCPVYRESYTAARDYFNLQGACWLPIPAVAQEVLGVVHQTEDPFLNDAVMTIMRGHAFTPAYINPRYMNDRRWKALAGWLGWARKNSPRLADTQVLLPKSWQEGKCPRFRDDAVMPREPYGYAHWQHGRGLVVLRNPWIVPQSYPIKIDATGQELSAVSLYPESRVYARNVGAGDTIEVPVAPYETLVLDIGPRQPDEGLPEASHLLANRVRASVTKKETSRVEFDGPQEAFGPDWTSPVDSIARGTGFHLEGEVAVDAPDAELLILLEGTVPPVAPICHLAVNGKEAVVTPTGSDTGWGASGMAKREHWLFLRAPLPAGNSAVSLDLIVDGNARISAWVWATKPGSAAAGLLPDSLPEPELISLGSAPLLEPVDASSVSGSVTRKPRSIERIDGIFLDSLEPVSVTQGWGTLQKNRSVWEKPLTIAGTRYVRGLGTHAPSRIVYALDGKYRRFQCWAGADYATGPSVTFEVIVDGKKAFESGLMKRDDAARRVDVDITGAKTLELIVGDGGNGIMSDHADWADARLLR